MRPIYLQVTYAREDGKTGKFIFFLITILLFIWGKISQAHVQTLKIYIKPNK